MLANQYINISVKIYLFHLLVRVVKRYFALRQVILDEERSHLLCRDQILLNICNYPMILRVCIVVIFLQDKRHIEDHHLPLYLKIPADENIDNLLTIVRLRLYANQLDKMSNYPKKFDQ